MCGSGAAPGECPPARTGSVDALLLELCSSKAAGTGAARLPATLGLWGQFSWRRPLPGTCGLVFGRGVRAVMTSWRPQPCRPPTPTPRVCSLRTAGGWFGLLRRGALTSCGLPARPASQAARRGLPRAQPGPLLRDRVAVSGLGRRFLSGVISGSRRFCSARLL